MGRQSVAVQLLDQPTLVDDPDPSGQPIHLAQDVARHEHGHATFLGQAADQLADLDHSSRIKTIRRFVQHQQLRLVEQCPGERQPLQIAERKGSSAAPRIRLQAELGDHPVHRRPIRHAGQAAGHVQVLRDGQLGIGGRTLDEVADPSPQVGRSGSDRLPEEFHAAGRRADHAQEHPDRRRLPGAVQPQEGIDLAAGNLAG